MDGKSTKKKNTFTLRIYDEITLRNVEELQKTGNFNNQNELLVKALEIGTESLLKHLSKAKALTEAVEVKPSESAKLNEIAKISRDILKFEQDSSVIRRIEETMLATLYNVEVARIRGEEVSAELMDGGYFSDLPEQLSAIKEELYGSFRSDKNEQS